MANSSFPEDAQPEDRMNQGAIANLLRSNHVRIRILTPLVLAIALLQVIFMSILAQQQQRSIQSRVEQIETQVGTLLESELHFNIHHLTTILERVYQDERVIEALRTSDRAALNAYAQPFFASLQGNHGHANYFEFYLRDRRSFLNVTHPTATGHDELSSTVLRATGTQETLGGVSQKRNGETLIYTLAPVVTQPTPESRLLPALVGYVELGATLDQIFHNMTKVLDLAFVVAIKKSHLSQSQWEAAAAQNGQVDSNWHQFPDVVVTANDLGTLPPELLPLLRSLDDTPSPALKSVAYRQGDRAFQTVVLPLQDVAEQEIGYILAVFETTPLVQSAAWANQRSLILSLLVSGVLVIFFYLYLGRVEQNLRRSHSLVMLTQAQLAQQNQALAASRASLRAANVHLEERVAERTAQLAEAKDSADRANLAKSHFLANMSHELRTPLNGIMGYAQVLQRSSDITPADKDRIRTIFRCGSYLLSLINDVLDLSKIEADKMELHLQDFNLPALLHSIVEMCRIRADVKGIRLDYQFVDELPVGIHGDEQRLRQILINLLGNAIKYTDKGVVTFRVGFATVEKLRFEVQDTGVGMTPDQVQRIFAPFEQVGDYRQTEEGSGLGLAISKRLVEMMGSQIQVESQKDMGSRFWFDLPIQEAEDWAIASRSYVQGQIVGFKGERRKILVIDDKEANRNLFVELLEPVGFDVQVTDNGWQGLSIITRWHPDLVLVDLLMPGMDGFEVISRIKQLDTAAAITIIATSASVFDHDQYQSFEAGSDEFLPKPVHSDELYRLLQKYLDLEWIYQTLEAIPVVQSPLMLASVPVHFPAPEVLAKIQELALRGNMREIVRQAQALTTQNPDYTEFSAILTRLANGFRDDEILDLIHTQLATITP